MNWRKVSPRYQALRRALKRGEKAVEKSREAWKRLLRLRKKGKGDRLARRLLGIAPKKPMPKELIERWRK